MAFSALRLDDISEVRIARKSSKSWALETRKLLVQHLMAGRTKGEGNERVRCCWWAAEIKPENQRQDSAGGGHCFPWREQPWWMGQGSLIATRTGEAEAVGKDSTWEKFSMIQMWEEKWGAGYRAWGVRFFIRWEKLYHVCVPIKLRSGEGKLRMQKSCWVRSTSDPEKWTSEQCGQLTSRKKGKAIVWAQTP